MCLEMSLIFVAWEAGLPWEWESVGFPMGIPIWDGNWNDFKPMGIPTCGVSVVFLGHA